MKFSEQRDSIAKQNGSPTSIAAYQVQYLSADHFKNIDAIRDRCVYHLFEDLAKLKTKQDFNQFLGNEYYYPANEFAQDCVQIAFHSSTIYGRMIRPWTDAALKCFDNFLIQYIHEVLQEKVIKTGSGLKETDVYWHLIGRGGVESEIGTSFKSIYESRNSFTHVQYEDEEGRRKYRPWSAKKYSREKELILSQFEKGLKNLEVLISRESIKAEA